MKNESKAEAIKAITHSLGLKSAPIYAGPPSAEDMSGIYRPDVSDAAEDRLAKQDVPIILLKNGLCVANFSSPHSFLFDTGEVLPACCERRSRMCMLRAVEREEQREKWVDLHLEFELTPTVHGMLFEVASYRSIDVILVPLPVSQAVKKRMEDILDSRIGGADSELAELVVISEKIRVIRVKDRITKEIYSDRFCV